MKTSQIVLICGTVLLVVWLLRPAGDLTGAWQPGLAAITQPSAAAPDIDRERAAANDRDRIEKERAAAAQRERQRMNSAIQSVVQRDSELRKLTKAKLPKVKTMKDIDSCASVTQEMVSAVKSTDMSACPRDFVAAYYRYIAALQSHVTALSNHPQELPDGFEGFLYGVLKGIGGDFTGGLADYQKETKTWLQRVLRKAKGETSISLAIRRIPVFVR